MDRATNPLYCLIEPPHTEPHGTRPAPDPFAEAVFSPEEFCAFTRISLDTLQRYRRLKKGPQEINIGASVRFFKSDAIDWLKSLRSEAA
jgi:predicted DNA-binding transcriptional regulator AlpA